MSVTQWTRLEPRTETSIDDGLAARLHDPLWLLGRQWQLGELTAQDAGSPIAVRVAWTSSPIDRIRIGDATLAPSGAPLESVVERDGAPPDLRLRLRGGVYLVDLLAERGLTGPATRAAAAFSFAPDPAVAPDPLVERARGRVPDAEAVAAAFAADRSGAGVAAALGAAGDERDAVAAAVTAWFAWYADRSGRDAAVAWQPDRAEHRFAVDVRTPGGTASFDAAEYRGGRLDWDAFRARLAPAGAAPGTTGTAATLPARVQYPGMPAARWWELEDHAVDFGALETAGVARVVLAELALVYGADWFAIPLEVPVGALTRIDALTVTDTFGVTVRIRPTREARPSAGWDTFAVSADPGTPPLGLFVPAVLGRTLDGPPVEQVAIVRDETANLAWAVQTIEPDALGRPRAVAVPAAPPPFAASAGDYAYVPIPAVDPAWTPLVPVEVAGGGWQLVASRIVDTARRAPRGVLVPAGFRLWDDELPDEGVVLERRYQLARGADGRLHVWASRSKQPGVPRVPPAAAFDVIVRR
jgi:hypothetical protein